MTELILALGAGLLSFLSPCVLPLIPGYISYVSGKSLNELLEEKKVDIVPIILFTVGFSLIFIAFGATSSLIGKILLNNSIELRIFSGLIIILFSLQIIGIINLNFLNFEKRFQTKKMDLELFVMIYMAEKFFIKLLIIIFGLRDLLNYLNHVQCNLEMM